VSPDARDDETAVSVRLFQSTGGLASIEDTVVPDRHTLSATGAVSTDDTIVPGQLAESARRVVEIIDGDTVALPRRVDRAATSRGPAPAEPILFTATPVPARPAPARLRLPNGTIVPIDRPLVVGRHPRAVRIPSDPSPAFVTLSSPSREVSASHLTIEAAGDGVVVTDLHSANGTTVLLPDGTSRALVAGDSVVVPVGTILTVGDGNAVTVLGAVSAQSVSPGARSATDHDVPR